MKGVIYLDNAATTYPKPRSVLRRILYAIETAGGNPGRSGHALSRYAEETVYSVRCAVAQFFHSDAPERVVFTYNATYALNLAIRALAKRHTHILISNLEHNAVLRPICALQREGLCDYDTVCAYASDDKAKRDAALLCDMEKKLRPTTRMVVITHASNLCSVSLPLTEIGAFCQRHNLYLVVDASQSAGHLDIDMEKMHIDALCFPAHKGLYGIMGCGGVLFSRRLAECTSSLPPLLFGGSGVYSKEETMPDLLPEHFEAGTLSVPAIASLGAGIAFVQKNEAEIASRASVLFQKTAEGLCDLPSFRVIAPKDRGSVLLFDSNRFSPGVISSHLDEHGICVRAGLHCAPLAHKTLGSEEGAVRVSFGAFNVPSDVDCFLCAMQELAKKA